ncbi:MAG: ribose 5-phosphate isomerase B [Planctomycetales bacterium]|nr:ribose 5-phosphate isomerase B [Planctomycetales bacterium]
MQIAIGSDHAGFEYKERLKLFLIECGHVVDDFGAESADPIDYPLVIRPLAQAVAAGDYDRGIILGGSGNGEAIVANRVAGIRCTVCWNLKSARLAREHNDANVLSLGQRMLDFEQARSIVETWLETPFAEGRHKRRIQLIDQPIATEVEAAMPLAPLPHRTELVDEAEFICDSCRQDFRIPIDLSAGSSQELVEECPVCSYENTVFVRVDDEGLVTLRGDRRITG